MADNVTANAGSGGAVFATDDAAGVHHPYVKVEFGADNTQTPVSAANPLPVVQTGTHTVTGAGGTFPVTDSGGSLTVDNAALAVVGGGVEATALRVTLASDSTGVISVDDNGASLTVDNAALSVTGGGVEATALRVTLASDSTGVISVDDNGGALTVDGTVTAAQATAANLNATVVGTGTFAVQVDGNALTALQLIDNTIVVDDAAFTPATTSVNMAGFQADETATDSVDEGDAGAARMTLDRKQIVNPQPHTAGGLSIFRSLDLDETEEEVKATAGCVHAVWATNLATTTRFLKFYNATAANVTVGTTTPVITIALPGNTSDDISAHFTGGGYGIEFSTAITVAATTGIADADTGAPAANDVLVNIFYK